MTEFVGKSLSFRVALTAALAVMLTVTLIAYRPIDARNYVGYVLVENHSPFNMIIHAADVNVRNAEGEIIVGATMLNEPVTITKYNKSVVIIQVVLIQSAEQIMELDPNHPVVIKSRVIYTIGPLRGLKFVWEQRMVAWQIQALIVEGEAGV